MGMLLGLVFGAGLVLLLVARGDLSAGDFWPKSPPPPSPRVWPVFLDDVAGGLRAGLSLPAATWQAASRLPVPLRAAFADAERRWREGAGFTGILQELSASISANVFTGFCDLAVLAHDRGSARLPALLTELAEAQRGYLALEDEVRGRQASTVNAAKVALLAPWLVLALTVGRQEVRERYATGTGALVLAGVMFVSTLSFLAMRRLARIEAMQVLR